MKQYSGKLWETLLREGIVQGEPPAEVKADSPWYVKTLLGFSGWLAASFLLGFFGIGMEFIVRNSLASCITGGMLIAGAFAILHLPKNEFVEHLALAVSLTGQALVVWAIFKFVDQKDDVAWIFISLVQVVLALVMPNFLHRVFSSLFAALSFFMAMFSFHWPYIASSVIMLFAAWLWLNEFSYPSHMRKFRAIGYGLVLALVTIKCVSLFSLQTFGWQFAERGAGLLAQPWVSEVLAGAVMLYVVATLLFRYGSSFLTPFSLTAIAATIILSAASLEARGITVGITIILLGFKGMNRTLTGLGIISLLFYISTYYYQLDLTLLAKSKSLIIIGLVFLAMRWLLLCVMPGDKEAEHAS